MDIGILEYYVQESESYSDKVISLIDRESLRKKGKYEKEVNDVNKTFTKAFNKMQFLIEKIRRENDNSNKK